MDASRLARSADDRIVADTRTPLGVAFTSVHRSKSPRSTGARVLGVCGGLLLAGACAPGIDVTRRVSSGTLGDDLYSVVCDRLGASVLAEDLEGASYHGICHRGLDGEYDDAVDVSLLPEIPGAKAALSRELALAKLDSLVRHRPRLIAAIDAAIPDVEIPDGSSDTGATISLHLALLRFTQALTALYEANPIEPGGAPLMPAMTEALGGALAELEGSAPALAALATASGREGYGAPAAGSGALEALATYPDLRGLARALTLVFGPGGEGAAAFDATLTAAEAALAGVSCDTCDSVATPSDGVSLSRPRTTSEILARWLLTEDDAHVASGEESLHVVRRDPRGFAVPAGSVPGDSSTLPVPFVDLDADGLADVDGRGRFVDSFGNPLSLPAPFAPPDAPSGSVDVFGRPLETPFDYVDLSRTGLASLSRDLVGLLDPTSYGGGAPNAFEVEHEALFYALAGVQVLAGDREDARYDHDAKKVLSKGESCAASAPRCTDYRRFVAEASPLPDLAHALGQVLADPESDTLLAALEVLVRDHEEVVARLVDAGLRVKAIADEHDDRAAKGLERKAELSYEVPLWDEVASVVGRMADRPGLVSRLMKSLANDVLVSQAPQDPKIQEPPAQHLGDTLAAFAGMRDAFGYNPSNLNGLALNLTDGGTSIANPHHPVDRLSPLVGSNRSLLERSLQLIHDSSGVKACNKDGAKLHTSVVDWPIVGSYDECELFIFKDIAALYLDSLLPPTHPKRARLEVAASDVNALMNFAKVFADVDGLLESSSGVTGLTLHPTPPALNRLLFFGADSTRYGKLPDYDSKNANTDTAKFISRSIEPVSSIVCPKNGKGVPTCSVAEVGEVLRVRDAGTIFSWERLGFQRYLGPIVEAFAAEGCNAGVTSCDPDDFVGERLFLDVLGILWRHWPDADHGAFCSDDVPRTDPRHCSGAGVNRYEPILADAFVSDLVPALHAFAKVAASVDVTVERGPNAGKKVNGAAVVELLVKILFSETRADELGIVKRDGESKTTWVDGTPQPQVTVFSLFADALHGMDRRFETSPLPDAMERRAKWRRARSEFVDRFLAVEGSGANARFANRAVPPLLGGLLSILREQVNAHCPKRETTLACTWGRRELGADLAEFLSTPTFAGLADAGDALARSDAPRRELERFLVWALSGSSAPSARAALLGSLGDGLQLLASEKAWTPLAPGLASAARSRRDSRGAGALDRGLLVLDAVTRDAVDPHHALEAILPLLVAPASTTGGRAPIEVFADAFADVNRYDARDDAPFDAQDSGYVLRTLRELLTSSTRGFSQLYAIVAQRRK